MQMRLWLTCANPGEHTNARVVSGPSSDDRPGTVMLCGFNYVPPSGAKTRALLDGSRIFSGGVSVALYRSARFGPNVRV